MYINITKRKNKKFGGGTSCYIYLCKSKREDGKVKTNKKLIYTFSEMNLTDLFEIKKIISEINAKLLYEYDVETVNLININLGKKLQRMHDDLLEKSNFAKKLFEENYKFYEESQKQTHKNCSDKNVTTKQSNIENEIKQELIKAGYKALSKKYHPDMKNGDEEKFKILSNIYNELMKM